jgi:hypothetical protein
LLRLTNLVIRMCRWARRSPRHWYECGASAG